MTRKHTKPTDAEFEEDELRDRISEAFTRAAATPAFREFRSGLLGISVKQKDFVKLWIEEAIRAAKRPTTRQAAGVEHEEKALSNLPELLTGTQKSELIRAYTEANTRRAESIKPKRIPLSTYRVLHSKGLISTNHHLTELGTRVALMIRRTHQQT